MKKKLLISFLLFVIPYCVGLWIKSQLWAIPPNILSERNLNFCLQDIMWWPIGFIVSGLFAIRPQALIPDEFGWKSTEQNILKLRIFSAVVFMFTFYFVFVNETMRNACFAAAGLSK
jgi:hypothetical protein